MGYEKLTPDAGQTVGGCQKQGTQSHLSYNLNSLKGAMQGTTTRVFKGDTRSLDYGSVEGIQGPKPKSPTSTQDVVPKV